MLKPGLRGRLCNTNTPLYVYFITFYLVIGRLQLPTERFCTTSYEERTAHGRNFPFFQFPSSNLHEQKPGNLNSSHDVSPVNVTYIARNNLYETYVTSYYLIQSKKKKAYKGIEHNLHASVSLLAAAGDIESNPGPAKRGRKPKYPCGICQYSVKNNDSALECDSCNIGSIINVLESQT